MAMLDTSAFAILVLTRENRHADKRWHARENVIHELGLFQGRLGYEKAVILMEAGVERFSNIDGLTYIEFSKGDFAGSSKAKKELRKTLAREGLLAG
jgi:predicted nucleotide-binding protein